MRHILQQIRSGVKVLYNGFMARLSDNEQTVVQVFSAHSLDEFLEECRGSMRVRRLSLRTEKSYLHYIAHYIRFHHKRPELMGRCEVEAYLTHLAREKNVAVSTQKVAFNALLYLYRNILNIELNGIEALQALVRFVCRSCCLNRRSIGCFI